MQPLPPDFEPWNGEEIKPPVKKKLKPGVKTALFCLGILAVAAILLFGGLFRIRTVHIRYTQEAYPGVADTGRYTQQALEEAAGIREGISYFTVTDEYLRKHLEDDRYLVYEGMEKSLPGTLTIQVKERFQRANVYVMGINYILDEEGFVLERAGNMPNDNLPFISGMQTRSVSVGKVIVCGNEGQLNGYQAVMQELLRQGYLGEISELKVSDPENLYMLTKDGYTINLGDDKELRAKIGTARAVVSQLKVMHYEGGVIDASVPAIATYTPNDL